MLHIAHPGICRMVQLARRYFYWLAMHDDIEKFVKNCYYCNQTPPKELLHPWPDIKKSWTRIHIDFAGPIQKQILIIVDSYSKFVDAVCFSTITTAATGRYLRRLFYHLKFLFLTTGLNLPRKILPSYVLNSTFYIFVVYRDTHNLTDKLRKWWAP